ncbi:hypothetical protein VC83_00877 [Pseudogymnoascus destructans]|uniref:Uncharacterized protein n=2 Tax=Pseudogymnoascus destructans TaxID=655981 RepID=L8FPQ5_PSED2|nr:uncharacterized protein VC83_00877 [Pseudogymnoascus destructans]ELR01656.1 hypothetical protein GMDG_00032 [Pseudogymnoascus destructans 20631-21]OAF62785.2 hypothetical protein VC83_00877 [Pseudogymnoascus destructans]
MQLALGHLPFTGYCGLNLPHGQTFLTSKTASCFSLKQAHHFNDAPSILITCRTHLCYKLPDPVYSLSRNSAHYNQRFQAMLRSVQLEPCLGFTLHTPHTSPWPLTCSLWQPPSLAASTAGTQLSSSSPYLGSICITSVSSTHALGQVAACVATLLIWSQFLYRLRAYLTPPPSRSQCRIHLVKRPSPPPQKMSTPYYQLQRPLVCHHRTCWAAAAAFSTREKKGLDGLTPFMREQWALAAPGIPQPDMEEILSTLTVTPEHHFERFVSWAKESWESLPRKAELVISALVLVLAVRPAKTVVKFLSHVEWTRLYVVVGMLVLVWFCGGGTVERAPAPRYETVVSYYLVPEIKGWSR